MPVSRPGLLFRRAGVTAAAVLLVGCRTPGTTTPTPIRLSDAPRPFTVMTTDQIKVVDPAAIADQGSAALALNVFQRLMTAEPGADVLKPDAARDCIFEATKTYTCTLNKKLFFHNGHPLTSSDVKFSIERATRLGVAGSSASLLSSLRRIETPDPMTVRFLLSRPDTQFGWALASPAASIVDEELYGADEVRPATGPIVGSGPFTVSSFAENELQLSRFPDYVGRNPAQLAALMLKTVTDSATIEEAMKTGRVDVVWRGLGAAALTRMTRQVATSPDEKTADGYGMRTLTGVRVHQLEWDPRSSLRNNAALRKAITAGLQEDRTLDSIVPGGVAGRQGVFSVGGKATAKVTWSKRIQMTLGYDASMPDGRDIATQIRTRLEDTGGLSVRLRANAPDTDLLLVDRKAPTATALAWLQPYLEAPLSASSTEIRTVETDYRAATQDTTANALLAKLQAKAAADKVILPISQSDEFVFARAGVEIDQFSFGPGWQLGLFGMKGK